MFIEYEGKIINLMNVSSVIKTETLNDDGTVKTYDNTLTMQNGSRIVKHYQSESDRNTDYTNIENACSGGGGGGTSTDVRINGTSITSSGVADILTNTAYNSSSNKIATMSDISAAIGDALNGSY